METAINCRECLEYEADGAPVEINKVIETRNKLIEVPSCLSSYWGCKPE